MKKKETNQLDQILAPIKAMDLPNQLAFWRRFRAIHRRRIAKTEAPLCPDVLKAVDAVILQLKQDIATGGARG